MRRVFLAALLLVTVCSQGETANPEARPARWLRQFGWSMDDVAYSVATDAAGNAVVAGGTRGALDIDTSVDGFVVKYDAAGTRLWTRLVGTAAYDEARSVATDAAGNVLVAGFTDGVLEGNTSRGDSDGFVVKYDAAGTRLWTRQLGTAGYDLVTSVATDAAGNVVVAGYTLGAFEGYARAGGADAFVVKYDAAGTMLWARQFGTASHDQARSVATDAAGNVLVAGFAGTGYADLDAGKQLLVRKYDAAGTEVWTRGLGSASDDEASSVATDAAGNVLVAGLTSGQLGSGPSAGSADLYVMKLDATGATVWVRQLGTAAVDEARSVATDAAGNAVVAGCTSGALDGNASAGGGDAFVVKYDASGSKLWTRQLGTAAYDAAWSVATDGAGDVLVAGTTGSALEGSTSAGGADAFVLKLGADGLR
jgi:hypothetical protein